MAKDYKYKLLFREMARPPSRQAPPEASAPDGETALAAAASPETATEPTYDFAPVPPESDDEPQQPPATTVRAEPPTKLEPIAAPSQLEPPPESKPEPAPPSVVPEPVIITAPEPEVPPEPEPSPPEPEPEPAIVVAPEPAPPEPEPAPDPIPEPVTVPEQKIPAEPKAAPQAVAAPTAPPPAPEPPAPPATTKTDAVAKSPPPEPPRAQPAEQDRPTMPDRIRLPRVLLTNDDGIDAPGLQVLAEVAATFADEVWIIAPEHDQSGTSMSLALHHPRRIYRRGARSLAVSGSPADCIALASYMLRAEPPALVLSGINAGQNVGDDANLSGTLGAALTALTLGIPSIAISQCYTQHRDNINWDTARMRLPALLQELLAGGWPKDHCLSINIPPLPPESVSEALWTRQAPRTISGYVVDVRTDLRGFDYCWLNIERPDKPAPEDTDLWAIEQGCISISCLSLDRSRPVPPESISLTGEDD